MSPTKKPVVALLGIFTMLVASLFFATSSQAYPAGTPARAGVSNATPRAGGTVTVSGDNFQPGESVQVTLGGASLGTFIADSSGHFSASVQLPDGVSGTQDLVLTGLSSGNVVTIPIDVGGTGSSGGGSSGGGSGGLSGTGVAVIGIAALGLVLLAGGGLMLTAGRRRKVGA